MRSVTPAEPCVFRATMNLAVVKFLNFHLMTMMNSGVNSLKNIVMWATAYRDTCCNTPINKVENDTKTLQVANANCRRTAGSMAERGVSNIRGYSGCSERKDGAQGHQTTRAAGALSLQDNGAQTDEHKDPEIDLLFLLTRRTPLKFLYVGSKERSRSCYVGQVFPIHAAKCLLPV